MSLPRLIIWDFDGVLCDSLVECVTVAKVAATRIERPELAVTESNLHEICRPDTVMALYGRLRPLRPFVVKGQDYLWQYFHADSFGKRFASSREYRSVFEALFDEERDREYERHFYEARKLVQKIMGQQYFTLFKPYPGVLYAFRTALMRNRNYICTARDQQGVCLLFGDNAIAFPRERIFSKDCNGLQQNDGRGKTEQILGILDREGGREQRFLLIEDQVKSPMELKDTCRNMEVIFAAYGYGLDADWDDAGIGNLKRVDSPEQLVYSIF